MKKSTILAVDDAPYNLQLLGQILSPDYRFLLATRGADGLEIEVHHDPLHALSDGPQALTPPVFEALMKKLAAVAQAVGREL